MYECLCGKEFETIPEVRNHLAVKSHGTIENCKDYPSVRDVVRNSIGEENPLKRRIKEIEILDEESREGFKNKYSAQLRELKKLKEEMN